MAYTEFTARNNGSNLYAGSLDGSAEASTTPLVTYTNGGWNSGTGVFTPASGNPVSDGVAVGQWVSVYTDGASAPTGFVARVTARDSTTITLSTTAKGGTAPTTAGSGITVVVGGAWKGPNGTDGFPFTFNLAAATNSSGHPVRVNFKDDATYSISAAITQSNNGYLLYRGYSSTFGDSGRAIVDGGSPSASFVMLTFNGVGLDLENFVFRNNGTTSGTSGGVSVQGGRSFLRNVVVHDVRGVGIGGGGQPGNVFLECETYACNKGGGNAPSGGFSITSGVMISCYSHDHTAGNTNGFVVSNGGTAIGCIADTCASDGFRAGNSSNATLINCEAYNCTGDGADTNASAGSRFIGINSNFIKNAYQANLGSSTYLSRFFNCGIGSGTMANTSGQYNGVAYEETGTVTYGSNLTPWVDPGNGDFRIVLPAAMGAGRGTFTQYDSNLTAPNTVAYPDIGAARASSLKPVKRPVMSSSF